MNRNIRNLSILTLFCLCLISQISSASAKDESMSQAIQKLYSELNTHSFWEKDQKYIFPVKWEHKKGIYESRVHFNFVDKINTAPAHFLRDDTKVDDINMFVTSFVLYGLLEANQLQTIKLDEHKFSQSLNAINDFRDKNIPEGIPQYSFWNQINVNGTWVAYATNLLNSIDKLPNIPKPLQNILNKIGLGILTQAKNIKKYFTIPPDLDDSSVNLALLAFLKQTNSTHYSFWNSFNLRKQQFYERALKYAYRPFGPRKDLNPHADEIDARTYFVLHKFLQEKKSESPNPSLILPSTWLIGKEEQMEGKIIMPFKVNNVDATVSANFLFGLCYQLIMKEVQLTQELHQMMLDTTDLLIFTVQEMLKERPTLILVYYPSKFDFYWFVSRIVNLLKRYPQAQDPLPQILVSLQKLMKEVGTLHILQASHTNKQGQIYWAQFLGNYGKKQRNEDALFSTCLAINALIDTWTTRNKSSITFDPDTPKKIKDAIESGTNYILRSVKDNKSDINAFFSGSVKGFTSTMPFFFPSNVNYDNKHPEINPNNCTLKDIDFSIVSFMKGYIEKDQYEDMLTRKWFGYDVPIKEVGLNEGFGMVFPFWSSKAITQIMGITALSKASKLLQNSENNLRFD